MAIEIQAKDAVKIPRAFRLAISSAINKTIKKADTAAGRAVRAIYNIKARDLKKAVRIIKSNSNKLEGRSQIIGQRLRLFYFGAKQNKTGVSVRIRKDSGRKTVKSAFIATMPSGLKNAFRRQTKARLPIQSLTTLDPASMYDNQGEKQFDKTIKTDLGRIFDQEFNYRLSKI